MFTSLKNKIFGKKENTFHVILSWENEAEENFADRIFNNSTFRYGFSEAEFIYWNFQSAVKQVFTRDNILQTAIIYAIYILALCLISGGLPLPLDYLVMVAKYTLFGLTFQTIVIFVMAMFSYNKSSF